MIHQDLPHQVSGNSEEVRAALPIREILRYQPKVRFVYECSGLQGRRGSLVTKIVIRQTPQFPIYQGYE
jgi:hypothetical protein